MRPIITVEHLSKRYQIGRREPYRTLRESLMRAGAAALRGLTRRHDGAGARADDDRHIWAVNDVSFQVAPGEVLGIIGRNGAGKSTLLKILARITEPTSGRVDLYGRLGSLLEVGTGFHPELTGRENIFLSGVILGMRRAEIVRRFDEIVAFSEIAGFLDTPVKHYSSGMYVRLAFAVAAHLQPEILLVDEVLAVGDAAFQKKCLGKMGEVARGGRTVIFVSHNMAAIEALCGTCLLLRNGRLEMAGAPAEVTGAYLASDAAPGSHLRALTDHPGRRADSVRLMTSVSLRTDHGEGGAVRMGSTLGIEVSFSCPSGAITPVLGVTIKNALGMAIFGVNNKFIGGYNFAERASSGSIGCEIEHLPLMPGIYFCDLFLNDGVEDVDVINEAISFEVLPTDVFGTGQLPPSGTGPIFWPATFSFRDRSGDKG
jgi:homopolymeric O-antigen transport system ATP-binding protein